MEVVVSHLCFLPCRHHAAIPCQFLEYLQAYLVPPLFVFHEINCALMTEIARPVNENLQKGDEEPSYRVADPLDN